MPLLYIFSHNYLKYIFWRLDCFVSDFIYHQYGTCLIYSEENLYHDSLLHVDIVFQSYTLIESLERDMFDERYTPYIYMLLTFIPNSTDLFNGMYIMETNATMLPLTF